MALVKVAAITDLKEGEGKVVKAGSIELALFRKDGKFYAIDNKCAHEGGPLGEGKPFVHAHITLSDTKFHAFGGHLNEAVTGPTLEIFLTPSDKMERKFDEEVKLELLEL